MHQPNRFRTHICTISDFLPQNLFYSCTFQHRIISLVIVVIYGATFEQIFNQKLFVRYVFSSTNSPITLDATGEKTSPKSQSSHSERSKSCQLRSDAESLINAVATSVWDCWSNTNNALNNRSSEMLEAKSKMQLHLHKVGGIII